MDSACVHLYFFRASRGDISVLGSCDDDGVVVLDVLAGNPVAGSEGVVGLVPRQWLSFYSI